MDAQERSLSDRLAMARTVKVASNSYTALYNQALTPLGLTGVQCEILLYLYRRPSEIVGREELLQFLQISSPSLSMTLKKLKQKGYIRYLPGEDMRKKRISLTVKALDIQHQLTATLKRLEEASLWQVTDLECEAVRTILQKVIQSIENTQSKDGG